MIKDMESSHIQDVVNVHMESFPDSFLTQLGNGVLTLIYNNFPKHGFGYVFLEGNEVAGFLAGPFIPARRFYMMLIRMHPVHLPLLLVGATIRSPRILNPIAIRAKRLFLGSSKASRQSSHPDYQSVMNSGGLIAYALTMAVSSRHRGKGIAKQLWAHQLRELPKRGVDAILGSVFVDNDATNGLYKKMGFRVIGRILRPDGNEELKWLFYKRGECSVSEDGFVSWHLDE